ncbi:3-deoxy-D-manno-octulosonic acid transferase [Dawidia soli]|uniref:3-deoxy-D-manno-octulosonic acid transferase n=1 Tax=Dawidia soli TaxID=2782352 RepID=A0AAP2GLL1_9BACT|nr:glycosyltransferase N-terminal domain-containing protein [Dawidia soli]MBT1690248.1 3-deoxy-D-manno-octulosonic acid transferase [Dawidia soli]
MIVLYNLAIFLLGVGARVAALFHPKAKAFAKGRKRIFHELAIRFERRQGFLVWVHCASLGEFEQGRPLMEALKERFPDVRILLTFFSPSGYEVRKHYDKADYVCYMPLDTAANARRFVSLVKPDLAIFVKYEFWHHFARTLHKNNIPLLSVSAIFRQDQLFFQSYGGFYRNILKYFSVFFVQNDESVRLLHSIGIDPVKRAGDTRFDRVYQVVQQAEEIATAKRFKADQKVLVVGSSWTEDLDVLIPFINEDRLKFIIAPHEIHEASLVNLERALQVRSVRYSQAAQTPDLEEARVLIIDNVGMLSRLYRYGEFAYVGGAFGKGLHNILEAACYGVPIFFGNRNYEKFQEAVDLINRGGAFEVSDYPDFKAKYEMLNIPENFLLACEVTRQYVEENLGATRMIIDYVVTTSEIRPA